jgi:predicted dehydrogenase
MALSTAECDAMIAAAAKGKATLAVGHLRRFFHSSRFVKRAIELELLGPITGFDAREGTIYSWPAASDFTFRKESGGGVLSDQGAHTLDTLLWWLGEPESVEYRDDAEGGVEADCEIRLRMKNGAQGVVELSRTRELRGTVILHGERGSLEIESKFDSDVQLRLPGEDTYLDGRTLRTDEPAEDVNDIFRRQLADFIGAIRQGRDPVVSGTEARRAVACLEACRAVRQPLELPWQRGAQEV